MDRLIENLRAIVGHDAVLSESGELLVYECDGLPQHKHPPRAVVFPTSTEETCEVMRLLARGRVSFTPRGAGTGLSGGALALDRGVVIELARMRKILSVDETNRTARVQTGVVNSHVSRAVAHLGLHYVPDPSSQPTCSIGGNIAENAGGIHCLKYGTTTDHVLSARIVLAGGEIIDLGGPGAEIAGYDLLGVFVGSEGTFGIATEAVLKLVPLPPAVRTLLAEFQEVNDASHAVSAIIAAGVMPAALEMMDREIIRAVEASVFTAGLSLDIGAALLIELDGIEAGIDDEAERVKSICLDYKARTCRLARDEVERKRLWAARKGAFGAVGRIAPDSMIQDAVVPRSKLPEVLAASYRIAEKYHLRLANVFHAGDGNLHPLICFDSRSPEEVRRVKEAGRELMETCVRAGGSITGEHGVGLDKKDFLPLIFSDDDMDAMLRVRSAFDPLGLCNPGKIIPMLSGCGEARAVQSKRNGDEETGGEEDAGMERHGDTGMPGYGKAEMKGPTFSIAPAVIASTQSVRTFDADVAALRMAQIVGDSNITESPSLRVSASFSVTPGSIEEVCAVMRLAASEGWAVVPAGAATWLDAGNPLERVNIVVSTGRLNQILEHEPADLVASAQAGVTLDAFNRALAQGGQWLPLDPPDDGSATVGGVVATGLSGAQKCGYGSPRNFVIGMRVVLANGKLIKAGGRVVKNVAGYDLCKLFTGSYGTLGLITELTFKLRPRPARETTVVVSGPAVSLFAVAQAISKAPLFPVALEIVSPGMAVGIGAAAYCEKPMLLARFAGIERTVVYQTEHAVTLAQTEAAIENVSVIDDDEVLWRNLAAVPLERASSLVWRASVKPAQLGTMIAAVDQSSIDPSMLWHAGVGDGRIRVIEGSGINIPERLKDLAESRIAAEALGGSLIIEKARGPHAGSPRGVLATTKITTEIDYWGDCGSSTLLMNRVKNQLDPEGLLSPGRFAWM